MKPNNQYPDAGFSLIEVLVAVFVMAVLSTIGISLVTSTMSTQEQVEAKLEGVQQLELARSIMKSDFIQLSNRHVRNEYGESTPTAFVVGDVLERNVLVSFVRNGHVAPGIDDSGPTLQHVTYVLRNGELVRRSRHRLDPTPDTPSNERILLSGVSDLQMRYFNGEEWQDDWEGFSATGTQLIRPMALAFEIQSNDFGFVRMVFSTPEGY